MLATTSKPSNYRAGVDAGLAALFAFGHRWPGTTQHGRSVTTKFKVHETRQDDSGATRPL
jgi:hypothetical protein